MKEAPIIPLLQFENNALPFKIQTITGLLDKGDDIQNTVHSHNYYEMIWLIKGMGTLCLDLREYETGNDSIFCIRPNQAHRFYVSADMEGFVFSFTDSFFNTAEQEFDRASQVGLFQIFSQSSHIRIASDAEPAMKEIAALMIKEYENQFASGIELLKRYFRIFLIYLSRQTEETSNAAMQSRETSLLNEFMEMLEHNFKEKKMVADYAGKLCVTPNYLNRVIKKNTGFPARHHIKQRVLLEAKRLGRYSNAGMKQIAYSLGFSDSAHFSKFFKSGSGTNFSDFKNSQDTGSAAVSFQRA
ncbi:MAG TPA: helix-turn-helix transcriptional regulator [Chitinophagaceae bacterium]|nr:helix-turn-helix transcriptional regulator [Chitinophagaceae bacterium]